MGNTGIGEELPGAFAPVLNSRHGRRLFPSRRRSRRGSRCQVRAVRGKFHGKMRITGRTVFSVDKIPAPSYHIFFVKNIL
jgi:hypothetical protein